MANLNDLTNEVTNIKNDIFTCYNELKDTLDNLNISTDNCKMLDMINKIGDINIIAASAKLPKWHEVSYDNMWVVPPSQFYYTDRVAYTSTVVGTKIYFMGGYSITDGSYTYYDTNYCYDTETEKWSSKKKLPETRVHHTAVAVGTKIYVMGGGTSTSTSTAKITNYCYDTETDTWSTMLSIPGNRMGHTAVAVGTKIYVIGGMYSSSYYSTNYRYDTETDTWTTVTGMSGNRVYHTAVAVGTKIYVMGGRSDISADSSLKTQYCYDTVSNSWSTKTSWPSEMTYRSRHAAVAVGTKIYVMGGINASSAYPLTDAYYDTEKDKWTTLNGIPAPIFSEDVTVVGSKIYVLYTNEHTGYIYHPTSDTFEPIPETFLINQNGHTSVAVGTKIYVMGGVNIRSYSYSKNNFCYDSETDTWTIKKDMLNVTAYHKAVAVGTKIYVMGGYGNSSGSIHYPTCKNYCYDTKTDSWTTMNDIPTTIDSHTAVAVGTKIYVMGGQNSGSYLLTNYCYDTLINSWSTKKDMPHYYRYDHAAVAVGTKIYVTGGVYSDTDTLTHHYYDTETDSWTALANMPAKRSGHTAVAVGTKIYVMGGKNGDTYYNTNYCYDTEENSWATMKTMIVKRAYHSAAAVGLNIYVFGVSYTTGVSESHSCYIV